MSNNQTNSQPFGYMGKILWVDLTTKQMKEEVPGEEIYRKYLGGYGLGVYYIYNRINVGCDPLGPDNILGFCPGLLTGNPAPFTGRYMVCGKSPLTGIGITQDGTPSNGGWGDANSGGYFGPAIKRAGYDAIFVTGMSATPVYLYIDDKEKQIIDASFIWGKDVVESDNLLYEKHGKGCNIASIGVGGENKLLIAGIVCDKGRIAARSGLGAVMGSKRLKAICVKGKSKLIQADKEKTIQLSKDYKEHLDKYLKNKIGGMSLNLAPKMTTFLKAIKIKFSILGGMPKMAIPIFSQFFHKLGTPWFTVMCTELGDSPIKNYAGSTKDFPLKRSKFLDSNTLTRYKKRAYGCFSCPVSCGAILEVPELSYKEKETHRPEYETIGAFGGLILNNDMMKIIELNEYLNREGVDTISAGGVVAFTLECCEKGILKKEDFKCKGFPDGFLPKYGETDYIMPLLRLMVTREGIGNILADGSLKASKKIPGSEEFAIQSNGQELPMHDGRGMWGLALSYAVDPTPGRHTAAGADWLRMGGVNLFAKGIKITNTSKPEQKGIGHAQGNKFIQVTNALGFCEFGIWCGEYPFWEMIKATFGWDMTPDEIFQIGYRIQTLRQMFNAREGAIYHKLAKRAMGVPPLIEGPHKKVTIPIELMIQSFYKESGFDETGIPKADTLKLCGLEFAIPDLPKCKGRPAPQES
jgi:aldehyde:ferredoxin oxidoreductase